MKKLILIILLLPLFAKAQVNGSIQRTASTGVTRYYNSGAAGIDTLASVTGNGVNGYVLVYNSTLKKSVWTNPTGFGTNFWSRNSGTSTLSPAIPNDKLNMGTGSITGGVGSFTSSGSTGAATITQSSGSGVGLTITKGGNGEGLIVNKTSGSGNAVTVTGTAQATTLVKTGGTGLQYLMADGSVTSALAKLDTSAYKRIISFDWGDSMTFGTGSTAGKSYPSQLSDLVGMQNNNRGVAGETSTQIRTRQMAATSSWGLPAIIWAGRNNYIFPDTVIADIAAMVDNLTTNKYLVLSVLNSYPSEGNGSSAYTFITELNDSLRSVYGGRFVDVRKALVNAYNPSLPTDSAAHAGDMPPPSLLDPDGVHLNDAGYAVVAATISQFLDYLKSSEANYVSGVKVQSGSLPSFIGKGLELSTSADGMTSYIDNVDRTGINAVSGEVVLGYNNGSVVTLIPFGGTLKSGTLPNYTSGGVSPIGYRGTDGAFQILPVGAVTSSDITVTGGTASVFGSGVSLALPTVNSNVGTFGSSSAIPSITVNAKGQVTAASNANEIKIGAGFGIISGGSTYGSLSPSATRGVIHIAGSSDGGLSFSNNAYFYNGAALSRWLTPAGVDLDVVVGGVQRLAINSSTGDANFVNNISAANLTSGTYTPTLTNGTGVASSTAGTGAYIRVGNQVSGYVDFIATGSSTTVGTIGVSLPIASNFDSVTDVFASVGTYRLGESTTSNSLPTVNADITNDRFDVTPSLISGSPLTYRFQFQYTIK